LLGRSSKGLYRYRSGRALRDLLDENSLDFYRAS